MLKRRQMLGTLGATAAAAFAGTAARAQEEHKHDHDHEHGYKAHLELMARCADVCNEASRHCLGLLISGDSDGKLHARAHSLMIDCQAFCHLTSEMMARGSELAMHAHAACAEACAKCAEACEQHGDGHEMMKTCAEICRECERACRAMTRQEASTEAKREEKR